MPIKHGVNSIASVYKGSIPINAIYKGNALVFSSGVWESYFYNYIYNSLIPETINTKQVKNKAKISKIYANGVIENQLVQNGNFEDSSEWSAINATFSVSNNVATVVATGSDFRFRQASIPIVSGNKYMFITTIKVVAFGGNGKLELFDNDGRFSRTVLINSPVVGQTYKCAVFFTATGTGNSMLMIRNVYSGDSGDTFDISNTMLINLSIREGVGNEPTTLTDNRIQKLLSRGYIAYNQGEYKSTDIGSFSSTKNDTTSLDTISLRYQGNGALSAHDTYEITANSHIFTKNVGSVDMGTLDWNNSSGNGNTQTITSHTEIKAISTNNDRPNMVSNWGTTFTYNESWVGQCISFDTTNKIWAKLPNNPNATPETVKQVLSGYMLYYELATPQVITIPRKRLGVVDLGSLNWRVYNANRNIFMCTSSIPINSSNGGANIKSFCSNYRSNQGAYASSDYMLDGDLTFNDFNNNFVLLIRDSRFTDATTFTNAISGNYLFYETNEEVADITNIINIEAGGTITSDSVVLPNVDIEFLCKN